MDWKKYANELETIIDAIDMNEHQRILVNGLMKAAKQKCEKDNNKELELPKPHYDIANFKPFDKVLVRYNTNGRWRCDIFSHTEGTIFRCGGGAYPQCIPFEGNEALLGTADKCDERFINW